MEVVLGTFGAQQCKIKLFLQRFWHAPDFRQDQHSKGRGTGGGSRGSKTEKGYETYKRRDLLWSSQKRGGGYWQLSRACRPWQGGLALSGPSESRTNESSALPAPPSLVTVYLLSHDCLFFFFFFFEEQIWNAPPSHCVEMQWAF